MKRILLSGGAGFVGSHLIQACLREGWQVGVFYKPQAGLGQIQGLLSRIQTYPVSGSTDEIFTVVEQFKPDLVFHLASIFLAKHTPADILALIQSNIAFGTQLLDAMATFDVPYFVNTGTSWQHYENASYNPVNLYAATKQAFEDIIEFYVQSGRITSITLKLYDTYGMADPRPKLFHLFEQAAREGTTLEMSPGEQLIDIVHVDDVASAFVVAARRLFDKKVDGHERYAVSSGAPIRLRDLAELYQQQTGRTLKIIWGGRPYREREVMIPWAGRQTLPGWKPIVKLEYGIKLLKNSDIYNG